MIDIRNIWEIVENLKKEYGTQDPFRIAKYLDALILFVPLVNVNGFYQKYENTNIIYINQDATESEATLICAHELGHMILHNDVNAIFLDTARDISSKYENEANAFAIQLLQGSLNLNNDIPLIDWNCDNYDIKKRIRLNYEP